MRAIPLADQAVARGLVLSHDDHAELLSVIIECAEYEVVHRQTDLELPFVLV